MFVRFVTDQGNYGLTGTQDDPGFWAEWQFIQGGAHIGRSRCGHVRPGSRLEAQPSQALRHTVVDLVGDATTFGLDGLRLALALLSADVLHRDDHVALICRR